MPWTKPDRSRSNEEIKIHEEKIKLYEEKIKLHEEKINLHEEKIKLLKSSPKKISLFDAFNSKGTTVKENATGIIVNKNEDFKNRFPVLKSELEP